MSLWGFATSAAMLIVALLAPILGAFGDFKGYRKNCSLCLCCWRGLPARFWRSRR